jgi:glutamate/tyrosine decarboxylase-like PLP-dependent enzyme
MIELTPQQREELGRRALEWALAYFEHTADAPLYPTVTADQLRTMVDEPLPETPQAFALVMSEFAALAANGRKNGHPRMFGYVQSSASFAGVAADFLASALNQNVTSWRSAPSATTIEHQAIEWIKDFVGYAPQGTGVFLSGGSMANFAALAIALRASTPANLNEHGLKALAGHPRIYAAESVHMSIAKAASMLGLGRAAVIHVPSDEQQRIDPRHLKDLIKADREAGAHPICVVASAGEVNTGQIDPLNAIADVCAELQLWLHVDGSYGGFARRCPSIGDAMEGLERADSLSLDPHKWMFAPLDLGCLLVKDGFFLHKAFSQGASYIDVVSDTGMSDYAFWDHSPELSRRFRALKVWFMLKCHGAVAIRDAIENNIRVAHEMGRAIAASDDFELLAPVGLSIVCFRYLPKESRHLKSQSSDALDAVNKALMVELQRDGESYVSNVTLAKGFALRACIVNFRTTAADVDKLLNDIRRVWAKMAGSV